MLQDAQDVQLKMRIDQRSGATVDLPAAPAAASARAQDQINAPEFQFEAFDFNFDQELKMDLEGDFGAPIQRGTCTNFFKSKY